MKKFANDLDPLDAADGAAARRRQVKCQQPLGVTFKKSIEHAYLFLYDKCTTKRTG